MQLYNSLSRRIEPLQPLKPPLVTFYSCGPTVYDYLHVGNWLAFIRWDVLARSLRANGYDVNWYMNITDVGHLVSDADEGEDKLEKGAAREGKTAWQVADFYTTDFLAGLKALNISLLLDHLPRATDHIGEQIALIQELEQKGYAYQIKDGVYFDTSRLADYGKLAGLKAVDQKAGARVAVNQAKRAPSDFALWKFSPVGKQRDMEWDSPWGRGFPGWHIECSAMAMKYLGTSLDIHAGGIDHIPIHHTNEIAQSEAASGQPLAQIWLHSNFMTVDGTKLSKSLGNSVRLQDLDRRGFSAADFRLFALQSHYRSETNFSWDNLAAAHNRLQALRAAASLRWQARPSGGSSFLPFEQSIESISQALSHDLDTPRALAAISQLQAQLENQLINMKAKAGLEKWLRYIDDALGLDLMAVADINDQQKHLMVARDQARQDKDWVAADQLRDQLLSQGVAVKDTPDGQVWRPA